MKSYNLRNSGGLYTVGYFPDPVAQIDKMTIRKSTNDGVSWTQFTVKGDTDSYGYCVLPNPQDSRVIYVGGYVSPVSGPNYPVLFKTTDAGVTWNRIGTSAINQQWDRVSMLECDKTNMNKVFAGTNNALYLSTDAGSTWTCVTTSLGSVTVNALVIDATNSNNVFVATTYGGVLLSTNGGTTWRTFNENLTNVYVESIEYDAANMVLYAGTKNGGVFRRNLATLGTATAIVSTSGNSQSARINTSLPNPCVVTVTDAGGNPMSGVSVSFAIASAPSGATGQSLSTTTTSTNSNGQASTILTLGGIAGTYIVTATSGSLSGSPVTFTATATNPAPTLISLWTNRAGRGSRINVTLTGTNMMQGVTTVSFGADITVNSLSVVSASQIMVNISISGSAVTGTRDVSVTNASPGGGTSTLSGGFTIDTSTPTSVDATVGVIPREYALHDAYPNPFNPSTTIRYDLPQASEVTLRVYNGLGQEVATLVNEHKEAGCYQVQWQANIPSGTYMCRMQALRTDGGRATIFVKTKKMVFLK